MGVFLICLITNKPAEKRFKKIFLKGGLPPGYMRLASHTEELLSETRNIFLVFIMENYVLITLGILSSWLIWFIFLLHYALKLDKSFNFIIMSGKQLLKYWVFIILMLGISGYIFLIRLNGKNRHVELFGKFEDVKKLLLFIEIADIIILAIFLALGLVFGFLGVKWIYVNLKMRLLALYMYYYPYITFRKLVSAYLNCRISVMLYVTRRIRIFTDNDLILQVSRIIWPGLYFWLEPRIFRFILPYMMIFDLITQDGIITKVFMILPWYYIYSIIRTSWKLFGDYFKPENTEFSEAIYKSREVEGKTYRWVNIPTAEEKYNNQHTINQKNNF